jgi:pimeloyl-ACP methyl ester carboxylesterase
MDRVKLPHDDVGSGPPVVLLHAGVADRTMWTEHLEAIAAAGHRAIALDLPGFGEAPAATEDAPWTDVVETLDALGLDRVVLVGNSFGGAVALRVAALAPDRVSALVLVSAPPPEADFEPSPRLRAAWEAEESALERDDVEAAVGAVVEAWTLPHAPDSLAERVAAMQRRAFETQIAAGEVDEGPDPLEDPRRLPTLTMPALVVVGEHDMTDFLGAAESLTEQLPGARHLVMAGAGHLAPLEQPAAFRELLLGFLAERRL